VPPPGEETGGIHLIDLVRVERVERVAEYLRHP
jgi:hypothetical protein